MWQRLAHAVPLAVGGCLRSCRHQHLGWGARAASMSTPPREYSARPVAAVALFICDTVSAPGCTKILAIKRGKEPGKGTWSLPGGGVSLGERCVVAVGGWHGGVAIRAEHAAGSRALHGHGEPATPALVHTGDPTALLTHTCACARTPVSTRRRHSCRPRESWTKSAAWWPAMVCGSARTPSS